MLKDNVIVVTGGAGRLGKEFIKSISLNNGIGIIADIDIKIGEKIRFELIKATNNENIDFIETNITNKDSIAQLIAILHDRYGRIDALINNAYPRNKNYGRKFEDVEYSDFCENINSHLGGYFLISQMFSSYFKNQGYGKIINISSIYGVIAPRFQIYENTEMTTPVEYAVIKSSVIHFTRYLAKYLKDYNIQVNCISPGGILDNQPESFLNLYKNLSLSKGMLDPQDIAGTLVFLLSSMGKYINGQNIIVDDGYTL